MNIFIDSACVARSAHEKHFQSKILCHNTPLLIHGSKVTGNQGNIISEGRDTLSEDRFGQISPFALEGTLFISG